MTDTDFIPDDLLEHPPGACQPLEGGLRIPLTLLTPSPLNPRKRWSTERVARMVASLKTSGQVQPIRVRPNPQYTPSNGRPPYEIVVGETRWRAAPEAGLGMLEAVVGDYTDQQVIELGVVENTDRNDLHPLEEADAYHSLLQTPDGLQGYANVQDLAARFGQSPSYVYQRLKLRNLCPAGRDAFLADKIKASVALLIARMPDMAEQAKATATLAAGWGGEPYSYRTAAELLQRDYMLALAKAPFDILATFGVAGPCHQCPKRSGAAPDLFADVTGGDMCQDSRCYQAKAEEARQAKIAADAAQAAAAPAPAPAPSAPEKAPPVAAAAHDAPRPEPKKATPREAAATPKRGGAGALSKAEKEAQAVAALTRERFGSMMFRELRDAVGREDLSVSALRVAVVLAFGMVTYEAALMLYEAMEWPKPPPGAARLDDDFGDRVTTAGPRELGELLILLTVVEPLSDERVSVDTVYQTPGVGRVLDAYGINPGRWWVLAEAAAKTQIAREAVEQEEQAAGAARRKLSPTDAFIEQHGTEAAAVPARPAGKTPVKYRNPMTGETWSGRGLMPKWLKARMAEGHKLDEYLTAGTTAATTTEARDAGIDQSDEGDRDADE